MPEGACWMGSVQACKAPLLLCTLCAVMMRQGCCMQAPKGATQSAGVVVEQSSGSCLYVKVCIRLCFAQLRAEGGRISTIGMLGCRRLAEASSTLPGELPGQERIAVGRHHSTESLPAGDHDRSSHNDSRWLCVRRLPGMHLPGTPATLPSLTCTLICMPAWQQALRPAIS